VVNSLPGLVMIVGPDIRSLLPDFFRVSMVLETSDCGAVHEIRISLLSST
jgi:hypothetical protein